MGKENLLDNTLIVGFIPFPVSLSHLLGSITGGPPRGYANYSSPSCGRPKSALLISSVVDSDSVTKLLAKVRVLWSHPSLKLAGTPRYIDSFLTQEIIRLGM